jgi:hypothetical protein
MPRARDRRLGPLDWLAAAVLFVVFLAVYAATLAPGLSHPAGDSHEFTTSAALLRLARRTGYPLYTWLAAAFVHLVPAGEVAYRANLFSAVLGAAGVALLYLVGRRLDCAPLPAAVAAALFGVTTTFWSQAVVTEVYAPNVCLLALTLLLLLRWADRPQAVWRFAAFAAALGASLGTHLSNLGLAPAMALFVLLVDPGIVRRGRLLGAGLAAFLVTAAQFVWLPLRAHTAQFPNPAPDTLAGVYQYTLGAFAHLRFAYPLGEVPDRLAVYVSLLLENFTPAGVLLGMAGMWALLWGRPAALWLVLGLHACAVIPASQLAVPDLEVFFIPGYVTWTLFVAAGVQALWGTLARAGGIGRLARAALAVALAWWIGALGQTSFAANDRHLDTAAGDFERSVYEVLPRASRLVVQPGVFGQAARYFQDVVGLRPDVAVAGALGGPTLAFDPPLFSTVPVTGGRLAPTFPQRTLPPDAWYVPVVLGNRQGLVLWRAQPRPAASMVTHATPERRLDWWVDGVALVATTIEPVRHAAVPRVHVRALWQADGTVRPFVSTRVGETTLETHELGLGVLARYLADVGPIGRGLFVEEFDLVLPSTLAAGEHAFSIGVTRVAETGLTVEWMEVGRVVVD